MDNKTNKIIPGDYVLATKFDDGDPCDRFAVGFFREMLSDNYLVEDKNGQLFSRNGFSRCEKICQRVGNTLVAAMPFIGDRQGKSLWWWRRHVGELDCIEHQQRA